MPRRDIDPQLPYIQVERSADQQATALASYLGVSPQHALGGLVKFWQYWAHRERMAPFLSKKHITVSETEIDPLLRMCFGMDVPPVVLILAGFLERTKDGLLIKGSERILRPEIERLKKRKGTLGPLLFPESTGGSVPFPASSIEKLHRGPGEVRGKSIKSLAGEPAKDSQGKDTDPRHSPMVKVLVDVYAKERGQAYRFTGRDAKAVTEILKVAKGSEDAEYRFRKALNPGKFDKRADTIHELADKWNSFPAPPELKLASALSQDELNKRAFNTSTDQKGVKYYIDFSGNRLSDFDGSVPNVG